MGNNRYIPAADPALAQAIAEIQNRDRKSTTTGEKGGKGNTSFYDSIKKNESSRPIGLNYNPHTGLYIGLPPEPSNYKLEGMIPFLDDAKNYEPGSVSFEGLPEPGAETKTSIYQDVLDLYERNKRFEENVSLPDLSDYLNQTYTFEKPFTDDESFTINESYKPWLMHPQEELGLAVDAFSDINEAYDEYQAKERLTKEDITAINKIISELPPKHHQ